MNIRKLALYIGIPVVIAGWYLFRPELLFVNQQVNEKLPTGAVSSKTIAQGDFKSYAHETKGTASIVETEGKKFLRLTSFSTSNGPDVRVYLVKGSDSSQDAVKSNGFIELGSLKGNIGNQNYEIPSNVDLNEYKAVAIWCARFGVDFGGATLNG